MSSRSILVVFFGLVSLGAILVAHEKVSDNPEATSESRKRVRELQDTRDLQNDAADTFDSSFSLEDYAKLPEHSPPSHAWLEQCAEAMKSDSNIETQMFTMCILYRLGDCVKFCDSSACDWGTTPGNIGYEQCQPPYTMKDPDSFDTIAYEYGQRACPENHQDWKLLGEVLEEFGKKQPERFQKPPKTAIAIHLRLGDVLDWGLSTEVTTFLTEGGTSSHPDYGTIKTVRSVYDYLNDTEKYSQKKIFIVGGGHDPRSYYKSKAYANCLARGLAKAGRQVELQMTGDADRDFYFLSYAKYYMLSTGGYSRAMAHMVLLNGGTVIGPDFGMAKEDGVTIPKEPKGFDPSLPLEDYAGLSVHERPNRAWLEDCAEDLADDVAVETVFPSKCPGYRLGDCIKWCDASCDWGQEGTKAFDECEPPYTTKNDGSFATFANGYKLLSCPTTKDWSKVADVFQEFEQKDPTRFTKPPEDAIVIHLRLGTFLDWNIHVDAITLLADGGVASYPSFNEKSIRSVADYLDDLEKYPDKKVVIMGTSIDPRAFQKSKLYGHCLARGIAKAGWQVELRFGDGDPDAAFYYMSHAKHFMLSTGSYSEAVGHMVNHNGGEIIGPRFGMDANK